MKENPISYKLNSALILPFLATCAVISVVLPISTNNTYFYVSVVSFILATLSIPLNQLILRKVRGLSKKFKINDYFEVFHSLTLIFAMVSFLIWILHLGY